MARGDNVRDDLIALLRTDGPTRRSTPDLAAQMGVSKRTMHYALAMLRDEGHIVEQWSGPTERTIMWVGPDPDKDEACSDVDSRVPVNV